MQRPPSIPAPAVAILTVLLSGAGTRAAASEPAGLPPAADRLIDFDLEVRPIFEKSCFQCHGPERPKSRFRLDNRESALKGGLNATNAIVPGNSAASRLIQMVAGQDEEIYMPPPDQFDPLTPAEIGILRAWIDQGAQWSAFAEPQLQMTFSPGVRWVEVEGNRARFREVEGMNDQLSGGIERFEHRERLSPDALLLVEGHALFGEEDYRLSVLLDQPDSGFVRAGFEIWREYYDDVGGYAPLLPIHTFRLDRELALDVGRAWIDLGLTLPDRPQVVLGYEYQFRNGEKSTLQWGPVGTQPPFVPGTDAKNVYPAFKEIDESTHILKLDLQYELGGWMLEDDARVEFHELSTRRQNVTQDTLGSVPDSMVVVAEKQSHTSGANVLSVSRQLREWLGVSGGYLYSRLEGNASLDQSTVNGSGDFIFGDQWQAGRIDLSRESHVFSLAGVAGPWSGLTLSLGAQGEWTQQESVGNEDLRVGNPSIPLLFSDASPIVGNLDSQSARENVLLRWTQIPFTVVSVEARLLQEDLGRFEERSAGSDPFRRDTDAAIFAQDYRAGFTTSPWARLSLSAGLRHRDKSTDYTHNEVFHPAGYLYPGFILWRDILDDQVDARLVYRVNAWLRTSFDYRWLQSDFDSATGAVPAVSPGGPVEAARHSAQVYSFNAVVTPLPQLHLAGTLAYADSRTATAQNGADYLAPWDGDVYSAMTSLTLSVSQRTTLRGSYAYTLSDYAQGNGQSGLPAGIDYDRHAAQIAVAHLFAGNVRATLGYGYYQYREPTLGGAADYRAHALFATAQFSLP